MFILTKSVPSSFSAFRKDHDVEYIFENMTTDHGEFHAE